MARTDPQPAQRGFISRHGHLPAPSGSSRDRSRQRELDLLSVLREGPRDTNQIVKVLGELAIFDSAEQLYVGWDHGAVRRHLRRMEREGLVLCEQQPAGTPFVWSLTDAGRSRDGV